MTFTVAKWRGRAELLSGMAAGETLLPSRETGYLRIVRVD